MAFIDSKEVFDPIKHFRDIERFKGYKSENNDSDNVGHLKKFLCNKGKYSVSLKLYKLGLGT